jgi:hypothetical protein
MGLWDRDYMHERAKSDSSASRFTRTARSSSPAPGWGLWLQSVALALILAMVVFAVVKYGLEHVRSVPFPASGEARWFIEEPGSKVARLTLHAPAEGRRHYIVRLDDWHSGAPVVAIPVRAGESAVTLMPLGRYRMTFSRGRTWLGHSRGFGLGGDAREAVTPIEFYRRDNQVVGQRIELESPFRGNLETRPSFER